MIKRTSKWTWRSIAIGTLFLGITALGVGVLAQTQLSYTQAQVDLGKTTYSAQCVMCHGAELQGVSGPALAGDKFLKKWGQNTLDDFYYIMSTSMPQTNPGSLSKDQYLAIEAYVLDTNGFKAVGDKPLAQEDLKSFKFTK